MAARRKTWTEKLADDKDLPKVFTLEGKAAEKWGKGTMAIPAPREVDALMRQVPKGKVATINDHRLAVAALHGADQGCPVTIGIFAWIAAYAAVEQETVGHKQVTPWWRTIKSTGELNPKYPGGCEEQARRLEAEGHRIVRQGKRWLVDPEVAGRKK